MAFTVTANSSTGFGIELGGEPPAVASLTETLADATLTAAGSVVDPPVMLSRAVNSTHVESIAVRVSKAAAILLLLIGSAPEATASLSETLEPATLSAAASTASPAQTAALSETLAPATLSASADVASPPRSATLSETLAPATLSATASTGTNAATATLTETLQDATLSATAGLKVPGEFRRPVNTVHVEIVRVGGKATAKTLLLRLASITPATASLSETLEAASLGASASIGSAPATAALTATLDPASLSAGGQVTSADVTASLTETLADATLSAFGQEVSVSVLVRHRTHFQTIEVLTRAKRAARSLLTALVSEPPTGRTASLAETLESATLSATSTLTSPAATGSLSATLDDASLAAYEYEPFGTVFYRPARAVVFEEAVETNRRFMLAGGPGVQILPDGLASLTSPLADATLSASASSGAPVTGQIIGDLINGALANATLSSQAFVQEGATMMLGRESRPWAFQKPGIQLKPKRWPGVVTVKPPETAAFVVTLEPATLSAVVTVSEPAAGTLAELGATLEDAGLAADAIVFDGVDLFIGKENRPEAFPQPPPQLRSKRTRDVPLGPEEPPPPGTHVGALTATLADATLSAGLFVGDPLPEALAELAVTLEDARLDATNVLPPPPPTYIGSGEQLEAAAQDELLRKVREYWEERERSEAQARLTYLIELVDAIDEAEEAEWRSNPFGDS